MLHLPYIDFSSCDCREVMYTGRFAELFGMSRESTIAFMVAIQRGPSLNPATDLWILALKRRVESAEDGIAFVSNAIPSKGGINISEIPGERLVRAIWHSLPREEYSVDRLMPLLDDIAPVGRDEAMVECAGMAERMIRELHDDEETNAYMLGFFGTKMKDAWIQHFSWIIAVFGTAVWWAVRFGDPSSSRRLELGVARKAPLPTVPWRDCAGAEEAKRYFRDVAKTPVPEADGMEWQLVGVGLYSSALLHYSGQTCDFAQSIGRLAFVGKLEPAATAGKPSGETRVISPKDDHVARRYRLSAGRAYPVLGVVAYDGESYLAIRNDDGEEICLSIGHATELR